MPRGGPPAKFDDCWKPVTGPLDTPCHEWQLSLSEGYGQFWIGKRKDRSHRWAWKFANGLVPDGMLVCHRCDNRKCVNPGHLFLGTYDDNSRDMVRKGRMPTGAEHHSARLTEQTVGDIHELRTLDLTQRQIAEAVGVSQSRVSDILARRSWRDFHPTV